MEKSAIFEKRNNEEFAKIKYVEINALKTIRISRKAMTNILFKIITEEIVINNNGKPQILNRFLM